MSCDVVATFVLVLQEVYLVNTEVIHWTESFCNMELLNVPWYQVVQSGYCLILHTTRSGMASLEPEPTQHSRPTFVGSYFTRRVATFNPSLSRLLPRKRVLFLSLLVVGDVSITHCIRVVIRVGTNFCWWVVTFACSMWTEEDKCISFGNQALMENSLNCASYWENFW